MPAILGVVGKALSKALITMLLKMASEKLVIEITLIALKFVASKTKTTIDDKIVAELEKALKE